MAKTISPDLDRNEEALSLQAQFEAGDLTLSAFRDKLLALRGSTPVADEPVRYAPTRRTATSAAARKRETR